MDEYTLGNQLLIYCNKYKIRPDSIIGILEDQKVVPMIRGKATEINATYLLSDMLNRMEWKVDKLNLNAQPGSDDEDITVTHSRTGIIIKVECKNATRGSFKTGKGCRKAKVPHCTIKCHKSRSNIKLADSSNDRYSTDHFDIVVSNLSNAVVASATYTEELELINDSEMIEILSEHYGVEPSFEAIFDATYNDWRFARSIDLAVDGFVERQPTLLLNDDARWHTMNEFEEVLLNIVRQRKQEESKNKRKIPRR